MHLKGVPKQVTELQIKETLEIFDLGNQLYFGKPEHVATWLHSNCLRTSLSVKTGGIKTTYRVK